MKSNAMMPEKPLQRPTQQTAARWSHSALIILFLVPMLVSVQPVLREFSLAFGYKDYNIPYHPGAVKYYAEHNIKPTALPCAKNVSSRAQRNSLPLRRGRHTL